MKSWLHLKQMAHFDINDETGEMVYHAFSITH